MHGMSQPALAHVSHGCYEVHASLASSIPTIKRAASRSLPGIIIADYLQGIYTRRRRLAERLSNIIANH